MLSVNSNYGAAIALQNLNQTNNDLGDIQNRISTGLKIASAKDNGAVFAIAEGQRVRVSSISSVREGLARAESAAETALTAGDSLTGLLKKLKEKAVAAQDTGISATQRAALNDEFVALRDSIDTIVGSATFNGANLLNGNGGSALTALSSDLGSAGTVDTRLTQALGTGDAVSSRFASIVDAANAAVAADAVANDVVRFQVSATDSGTAGVDFNVTLGATTTIQQFVDEVNLKGQGILSVSYNEQTGRFTYQSKSAASGANAITITRASGTGTLGFVGVAGTTSGDHVAGTTINQITIAALDFRLGNGPFASKLTSSTQLTDATTAANVSANLDIVISDVVRDLATLGSRANAVKAQNEFLAKLSDQVERGISNLVDADLAKESARLQSQQIKQQLGAQALSIANQSPQVILNLFRG
jgi:flagellin